MIPTDKQIYALWDKYNFPKEKRVHVALVARVALVLAKKLKVKTELLRSACLLHDIDKNIPKNQGEKHPDTGVRILNQEGMHEIAQLVKTHSLHAILDPAIAPKTWEEKILYLSDKMVKYDIVGVDGRFALWRKESLPQEAMKILDLSYPHVKQLEQEIFSITGLTIEDIKKLA